MMSDITLRSTKGALLTNQEVDDNFSAINTDKYESGDNIEAGALDIGGSITYTANGSVAAAGTTYSDATVLSATYNIVSTATASQGVRLPTVAEGLKVVIVNDTTANINLYANSQDDIDGGAQEQGAGESVTVLKAGVTITLIGISGASWRTFLSESIQIFNVSGVRLV